MSIISRGLIKAYPGSIEKGSKFKPFVRPAWTEDKKVYTTGWYWSNADMPPDRFYFNTREECAEDLAMDIGFDEAEAERVLAGTWEDSFADAHMKISKESKHADV